MSKEPSFYVTVDRQTFSVPGKEVRYDSDNGDAVIFNEQGQIVGRFRNWSAVRMAANL